MDERCNDSLGSSGGGVGYACVIAGQRRVPVARDALCTCCARSRNRIRAGHDAAAVGRELGDCELVPTESAIEGEVSIRCGTAHEYGGDADAKGLRAEAGRKIVRVAGVTASDVEVSLHESAVCCEAAIESRYGRDKARAAGIASAAEDGPRASGDFRGLPDGKGAVWVGRDASPTASDDEDGEAEQGCVWNSESVAHWWSVAGSVCGA